MVHSRSRLLLSLLTTAGVALGSADARGWEKDAELGVKVHHHEFYRVQVESVGECGLQIRIHFNAPIEQYADPVKMRNLYRFKARLELSDDKRVDSKVWYNDRPGKRAFSFQFDTAPDGCWAKSAHKVYNLDVEGCRGSLCQVKPFG